MIIPPLRPLRYAPWAEEGDVALLFWQFSFRLIYIMKPVKKIALAKRKIDGPATASPFSFGQRKKIVSLTLFCYHSL